MNDLIFLDTETTGLEPDKHEVWEIAYAINDGPVESVVVHHSLRTADPKALSMNGYFDRTMNVVPVFDQTADLMLRELFTGNTLVCANPTFDRMFLRARWGMEPWHYRSIDVESMALVVFDWERPRGLKDIAEELRFRKYDIPLPDHSAGKDVEVTRAVYHALRAENRKGKIY